VHQHGRLPPGVRQQGSHRADGRAGAVVTITSKRWKSGA
jgi:hypothetical protein